MMKPIQKHFFKRRKNSSSKGPKAIQQEMHKKGIGKELQIKVLESYSEEEQLKIATKLAEKAANANLLWLHLN